MKKSIFCLVLLFTIVYSKTQAQDKVLLFSYFVDNGQDGLHFASSTDGLTWNVVKNGKSFLKPNVGKDKLIIASTSRHYIGTSSTSY